MGSWVSIFSGFLKHSKELESVIFYVVSVSYITIFGFLAYNLFLNHVVLFGLL